MSRRLAMQDTPLPIEIIDTTRPYGGFRNVDVIRYREADRGPERVVKREIMAAHDAVAVIAWDPARKRLLLIRQFRIAAHVANGNGMCVEVVAGLIKDDDPERTVREEVEEETGARVVECHHCTTALTSPGMTDEQVQYWFATVDTTDMVEQAGLDEETEETFPFLATLDEALAMVDEGRVANGIVMFAVLWFARHFEELAR